MQTNSKKDLYLALIKARSEFPVITKAHKGAHAKYENLADMYDLIIPVLTTNHLFIESQTNCRDGVTLLRVRVVHALSEQALEWSEFPLVIPEGIIDEKKRRNEEAGLQTYFRRYQIKLILGICGEDDDNDGEYISNKSSERSSPDTINEAQLKLLRFKLKDNKEREDKLLKYYKIDSLDQLPWKHMQEVLKTLGK